MTIQLRLSELARCHRTQLRERFEARRDEMRSDDNSHFSVYRALGIEDEEGHSIDLYQNLGRFLYNHAGNFLEAAALMCFQETSPEASKHIVSSGTRTYEVDCLLGTDAIEVKWRDATTDGDHVRKETDRLTAICSAGLRPIRVMFFEPNRKQAKAIQSRLKARYEAVGGEYYSGDAAWMYMKTTTGIDLRDFLQLGD